MKFFFLIAIVGCHDDAAPAPMSSVSAIPSVTASAIPIVSASAIPSAIVAPTAIDEIPPDWRACHATDECVILPSACCGAWPANVSHKENVRRALAAADKKRDNCRNRACAGVVYKPICEHQLCMVWQ